MSSSPLASIASDHDGNAVASTTAGTWKLAANDGTTMWSGDGGFGGWPMTLDHVDDVLLCSPALRKLAGTSGSQMWSLMVPWEGGNCAAIRADAAGDVVAAGSIYQSWVTLDDIAVVKLAGSSGNLLWQYYLNGSASFYDRGLDVATDSLGDVVAAGYVTSNQPGGAGFDYVVVKLAGATGVPLWQADTGSVTFPRGSLAIDAADDVIFAGDTFMRFSVVKLAGAIGAELWRQELSGTGGGAQFANAVAVDAAGDVIAGGLLYNARTGDDFTVIKFDRATGAEIWRREIAGPSNRDYEEVRALAVDANGDVVAVGRITNATPDHDFDLAVVKLDGASGAERWRRLVDSPASSDDMATGVAFDPSGDVVVSGEMNNYAQLTVLKLRGADGSSVCGGAPLCGNWCPDPGEACDDGNNASGDGCSSSCTLETGWTCTPAPSICTPVCGDGRRLGNEACDDGNLTSGDGCDANCTVTACGNGIAAGSETCDDGNTVGSDCCSATCQVETCDDGTICTADACIPGRGCSYVPAPFAGCRSAAKSSLRIDLPFGRHKEKLIWKWSRGQSTTLTELGDPRSTDDQTLCLYAGTAAALLASVRVPANATKWQPLGSKGYVYRDPAREAAGVKKVLLASGAKDNAKALVIGDTGVPINSWPDTLALPVRAQWVNERSGLCLESEFDAADENTWTTFRARAGGG